MEKDITITSEGPSTEDNSKIFSNTAEGKSSFLMETFMLANTSQANLTDRENIHGQMVTIMKDNLSRVLVQDMAFSNERPATHTKAISKTTKSMAKGMTIIQKQVNNSKDNFVMARDNVAL